MGALGMLAVQSITLLKRRNTNSFRLFANGILAGVLLLVLLGFSPEADVVVHLGGFVNGLLLGSLLAFTPRIIHRPLVNLIAGIMFAVLIILPWWWGLGHLVVHLTSQ